MHVIAPFIPRFNWHAPVKFEVGQPIRSCQRSTADT